MRRRRRRRFVVSFSEVLDALCIRIYTLARSPLMASEANEKKKSRKKKRNETKKKKLYKYTTKTFHSDDSPELVDGYSSNPTNG